MHTQPMPERSITLRSYGVSLSVHGSDTALCDLLWMRALERGWAHADLSTVDLDYAVIERDGAVDLCCNDETVFSSSARPALVEHFENHAKMEGALRAPHHVFVHAGVVGWQGGAIVVPGRSRAGKTTLVEAFVRAGAEYYSDEFAVLDANGAVHPYAIPLGIRGAGGRASVDVGTIGGRAGTMPLPVTRLLITQYHPRGRWRPRSVSPATGMLALMDNTVAARTAPERTMPVLRRAVEGATIVRSRRGDAHTTAQMVLSEIA